MILSNGILCNNIDAEHCHLRLRLFLKSYPSYFSTFLEKLNFINSNIIYEFINNQYHAIIASIHNIHGINRYRFVPVKNARLDCAEKPNKIAYTYYTALRNYDLGFSFSISLVIRVMLFEFEILKNYPIFHQYCLFILFLFFIWNIEKIKPYVHIVHWNTFPRFLLLVQKSFRSSHAKIDTRLKWSYYIWRRSAFRRNNYYYYRTYRAI